MLTAIDRERISKDVYQGLAFPAMNAIPEQFTQLTDPSVDYNKQFAYDPVKAGKMLDEAGFPLKDGKRFTVDFTGAVNADAFYAEPATQIIAANWRAIGVETKLSLLEGQLWTNKVFKDRAFDVSMVSLTARTDPVFGVDRSFLCNTGNIPYVNPTGYCNPELDKIAATAGAVPTEERRQWYKKYEEIIARDMPHLTLTNARKFFGHLEPLRRHRRGDGSGLQRQSQHVERLGEIRGGATPMDSLMDALIRPRTIAVIGASPNRVTLGNVALDNLANYKFAGTVIPVHGEAKEIAGLPAVASIEALPDGVDVALASVPAAGVADVVRRLEKRGVKTAIVNTAGFSETQDAELRQLVKSSRILMHGPNCMGLITSPTRRRSTPAASPRACARARSR